ncbi:MAG: hypothetical protein ACKVS6_05565 [Planctomycetota bacterium]
MVTSRTAGALLAIGAIFGYLEYTRGPRGVIQEIDSYLGWYMMPNQDHHDRSGTIAEHINSFGFRGNEWTLQKREGVTRIAVLGSSMTYGSSVEFDKIYTSLLEKLLNERGLNVEVLNCAVQGYKFEQDVRNYEKKVSNVKPDILIQAFADQDVQEMDPPGTVPKADLRPWITRTDFYYKFQYVWQPWVRRLAPESPIPKWAVNNKSMVINEKLQSQPFAPELMPLWEKAVSRMNDLNEMVRRDGGQLMITVLPQPPQTMNTQFVGPEFIWKRFVHKQTNCTYLDVVTSLQKHIEPFRQRFVRSKDGREQWILQTNMRDKDPNYAIQPDPNHVYHGDVGGHFNETGMLVIATALADQLEKVIRK